MWEAEDRGYTGEGGRLMSVGIKPLLNVGG
jgi:hypothetical protein